MTDTEFTRLKNKILLLQPSKYWGDDFDVRYYVVSKLKKIRNQSILDAGGGIGIVSSELHESNNCVNLDMSFSELSICKTSMNKTIQNVNGVMTFLPFKDSTFDHIVCCHVLDAGKVQDITKNNVIIENKTKRFPTVEKILGEFRRILKNSGKLTLTVPNNAYYQKMAFEYNELQAALNTIFPDHLLYFFNTLPRFGNNRKLNFANTIPKISSKIVGQKFILDHLLKSDEGKPRYSISFYVEAIKN